LHIRKEVEKGKLPADVAANLEELYYNYKDAVMQSRDPNAHDIVLSNMVALFDCVLLDVEVLPPVIIFLISSDIFLLCPLLYQAASSFCRIRLPFRLITKLSGNHSTITCLVRTTLGPL
jgi:hypothetical protein